MGKYKQLTITGKPEEIEELQKQLKKLAKSNNRSVSAEIRFVLTEEIKKHADRLDSGQSE